MHCSPIPGAKTFTLMGVGDGSYLDTSKKAFPLDISLPCPLLLTRGPGAKGLCVLPLIPGQAGQSLVFQISLAPCPEIYDFIYDLKSCLICLFGFTRSSSQAIRSGVSDSEGSVWMNGLTSWMDLVLTSLTASVPTLQHFSPCCCPSCGFNLGSLVLS